MPTGPALGCTLGDVVVDAARGEVRAPGAEPVSLSPMECEFLLYLARRHGEVVSKAELLQEVWRYSATVRSRAVDATLIRVRAKLEGLAIRIESVHGRGLQLLADDAPRFEPDPTGPEPEPEPDEPLIGREAELARMEAAFVRGARVLQLLGPAGMGKTALASAWAASVGGRRVDLLGIASPVALRRTMAAHLGIEGEDVDPRITRTLSEGPPTVLDHVEGLGADAEALLAGWLASGSTHVLVGSQRRLGLPGEVVVLSQLERAPAAEVVQQARARGGLEPLDARQLDELWAVLGGHPLALRIAAPLYEWMRDASDILEIPAEGGEPLSLVAAVTASLSHLSARAVDIAHMLAAFSTPPRTPDLLDATGMPVPQVLAALSELRLAGLVSPVDGRSCVLPAVRTVLRKADAYRTVQQAHDQRLVSWLLSLPPTHAALGPVRRELEWALHLVAPEHRLPVLTRHLLMLYAYGPIEDLIPEAERWAEHLPVEQFADGQEQVAWARFAFGDRQGAESLLVGCVGRVGNPTHRARGTGLLAMLHAWWSEPDAAELVAKAREALPDDAPTFLRLDTLTLIGSALEVLDPDEGRAVLEQVVVEAGSVFPARGLNAALSKLRGRAGSAWELDRARWLMGRAAATLSAQHAAIMSADLAIVLLAGGERVEALDRLAALRAHHAEHPSPLGNSILMDAAMRLACFPESSLPLLDEVDPTFSADFAAVVRSVAAGAPTADLPEAMEPLLVAMASGAPLPETTDRRALWARSRLHIARALVEAEGA
ncbi:MAG: winged helix-turn-helix domain-containing protein [Myxococcota bacterium]